MFIEDKFTKDLKIYLVGGAIRDFLLGLKIKDKDWVVVGSNPEEMILRGFIPVGNHFPVFLHPYTKEEYALARTERKDGIGYQGFKFYYGKNVSLLDDLKRRDLTINAIACDNKGNIIDPFNGIQDLNAKILRHVSISFNEDPLRILRLARFQAKFGNFSIHNDTINLCSDTSFLYELKTISIERIWKEISIGLCEMQPYLMLYFLNLIGALNIIMPEISISEKFGKYFSKMNKNFSLPQRYSLMCININNQELFNKKLKVSKECANYSILLHKLLLCINNHKKLSAIDILNIFEMCDVFRKTKQFFDLLDVLKILLNDLDVIQWKKYFYKLKQIDYKILLKDKPYSTDNTINIKNIIQNKQLLELNSLI